MIKLKSILLEVEGTTPYTYYHVTWDEHLKKIKKYGLKPREKGEWTGAFGQDIRASKGVFLFNNKYDAMTWAFKMAWDRPGKKVWILKIVTGDTDFKPDTHWEASGAIGDWLVKQSPVRSEQIVEYIPFDKNTWTPELTQKVNAIRANKFGLKTEAADNFEFAGEVKDLEDALLHKYPQLDDLFLTFGPAGDLHVGSIIVKEKYRRQGIGHKVMEEIKKFADKYNLTVTLSPNPMRGYKKKLSDFYKSLGFYHNKGRRKDYRLSSFFGPTMIRKPGMNES